MKYLRMIRFMAFIFSVIIMLPFQCYAFVQWFDYKPEYTEQITVDGINISHNVANSITATQIKLKIIFWGVASPVNEVKISIRKNNDVLQEWDLNDYSDKINAYIGADLYTYTYNSMVEFQAGDEFSCKIRKTSSQMISFSLRKYSAALDDGNNDTTLRLVSVSPIQNATDVDERSSIIATFSHPIDSASVTIDNFYLQQFWESTIYDKHNGSINVSDNMIEFTPSKQYYYNQKYILYLDHSIKDEGGSNLDLDHEIDFTTIKEGTVEYDKLIEDNDFITDWRVDNYLNDGNITYDNEATSVVLKYRTEIINGDYCYFGEPMTDMLLHFRGNKGEVINLSFLVMVEFASTDVSISLDYFPNIPDEFGSHFEQAGEMTWTTTDEKSWRIFNIHDLPMVEEEIILRINLSAINDYEPCTGTDKSIKASVKIKNLYSDTVLTKLNKFKSTCESCTDFTVCKNGDCHQFLDNDSRCVPWDYTFSFSCGGAGSSSGGCWIDSLFDREVRLKSKILNN